MQDRQDKARTPPTTITKDAEAVRKAASSPLPATRLPAWSRAMGDYPPANLQAKLTVNQPGDAYEQEADQVAEQVMRKSTHVPPAPPPVPDEEEEERRRLMRKQSDSGGKVRDVFPIIGPVLASGGGQPLDASTRATMESHFGQDFSQVRVHTDGQASGSARAMHARAYTVGRDVVFGAGEYTPGTSEGQRLLAHELTHVVQQEAPDHQTDGHGTIQRFEAPEHIDIGDTGTPVKVKLANGLELTYGEISALVGDFYETPEMLDKADPAEVKRLLQLANEQRLPHGKVASRDVEFQQATQSRERTVYDPATGKELGKQGQFRGGKLAGTAKELETESYFSLAKKNVLHFAPANLQGGWRQGHDKALDFARRSVEMMKQGKNDDAAELRRMALLTDAGYTHYLEDAFSAGHILNPVDVKDWMTKQWTTNFDFKERAIKQLKEAAYKDKWYAPNAIIDKRIDALLRSVSQDVVSSAGLKVLHDYLNRNGIDVINARGDRWKAFGDSSLWKSPDTLKFAGEAVALSKQQVLDALSGKSVNAADVLHIPPEKVVITGQAAPVPIGTEATKKLLVVLESLLLSTDDLWKLMKVAAETQEKAVTPFETAELEAATTAEKKQRDVAYGGTAGTLIKARSNILGLDEKKLATDLLSQPDAVVETVLDRVEPHNRDDVSLEYMKQIPQNAKETELLKRSLHLLLRLQAELLTGYVAKEEKEQASRIASILKRVPEGQKPGAAGEFTSRQAEVAIATVTGSAKQAVEEAGALKPERILDATQAEAAALIEKHRGFFGLDEGKLAADLKGKRTEVIIEVIDQLQPEDNDDDVSLEYMKRIPTSAGEADLRKEARSEGARSVLRRLRQALRSGSVGKDEEAQAQRIDSVIGGL